MRAEDFIKFENGCRIRNKALKGDNILPLLETIERFKKYDLQNAFVREINKKTRLHLHPYLRSPR